MKVSFSPPDITNLEIEKVTEAGIACNVHYKPLPMHTAYKGIGFDINGEVIGIVEENHIIAMLNLYCNNYETLSAYICNVYVLENYRGRNIAKKLIEKAIDICKFRNFKKINLHVAPDNIPAVKTYRNLGFDFTGNQNTVKDYEMCLNLFENTNSKRLLILGAGNAQLNLIIED